MAATPIANERFKQSSRSSFWISLTVATLVHAAVFAGSPVFALELDAGTEDETEITALPQVRMPEPPPPINPPAAPAISDLAAPDVTLDPVTPEEWRQAALQPPPPGGDVGNGAPMVTPMDVAPRLLNSRAVQTALRSHYPPVLRDASIGGAVSVWFHIDERGRVTETRIHRSSGYDLLDEAALLVADRMEFSPARNRDRRIPVWVALEIVFEVQ